MVEVIKETIRTANKIHNCGACFAFNQSSSVDVCDLSLDEQVSLAIAQVNDCKIQKGEKYINQTNKLDGEIYTFMAIPAMHDICIKYDLYDA